MKKLYEKPAMMVENFALSENIASCDPSFSNNMNVNDLIADVQGFTGYFTSATSCTKLATEGVDYMSPSGQKLCYHTSSAVVFSS